MTQKHNSKISKFLPWAIMVMGVVVAIMLSDREEAFTLLAAFVVVFSLAPLINLIYRKRLLSTAWQYYAMLLVYGSLSIFVPMLISPRARELSFGAKLLIAAAGSAIIVSGSALIGKMIGRDIVPKDM